MKPVSVYYREELSPKRPPLTHSGRNNKQIEQVNKWTPAPPPAPTTRAFRVTASFQRADIPHEYATDICRLSAGFPPLITVHLLSACQGKFFKSISGLREDEAESEGKQAGVVGEVEQRQRWKRKETQSNRAQDIHCD